MRKITIKNVTPENKSKNRLQKVFSFPKEEDIARDFFGWISAEHPLTLNGLTYDKVYFGIKFPVFAKTTDGQPYNQPANMDVVLISDDCLAMQCITSCHTEHTHHQAAIFKDAYFKPSCYYKGNPYRASFLRQALRYNEQANGFFAGVQQNISLLLGITNIMHDESALAWFKANNPFIESEVLEHINQNTEMIFTNLLYYCPKMGTNIYGDIHAEEKTYPYLLAEFLFDHLQNNLDEPLLLSRFITTYPELFAEIQSQMPKGLAEYLDNKYVLTNHA
ncbi:MAG: hypothetical protein J6S09_04490 [Paludibacteraceae bacterium]|nr:hypothetical protein [Paludibacteraceae bacterium]